MVKPLHPNNFGRVDMILIKTGSSDIYFNLAAEYYFAVKKPFGEQIFMLWQTSPPALVCGRYQNVYQEVHMDYVRSKGYRVARRLSGGGTVYQDENVFQYTFIAPGAKTGINFEKYMRPVMEAMASLGVPVRFNSRNDLVLDNAKVSGTAQYYAGDRVIHHGTVLYDADLRELERCLSVDCEKIRSKGIRSVRDRVTNMKQYAGGMSVEAFMDALAQRVMQGGKNTREYVLSKEDRACISDIAKSRFESWDWIFASSPECDLIKSGRVEGGRVEFYLSLAEGRIQSCQIRGDFFPQRDVKELEAALLDCRYEKKDLQNCLENMEAGSFFYRVTGEELLKILWQ